MFIYLLLICMFNEGLHMNEQPSDCNFKIQFQSKIYLMLAQTNNFMLLQIENIQQQYITQMLLGRRRRRQSISGGVAPVAVDGFGNKLILPPAPLLHVASNQVLFPSAQHKQIRANAFETNECTDEMKQPTNIALISLFEIFLFHGKIFVINCNAVLLGE